MCYLDVCVMRVAKMMRMRALRPCVPAFLRHCVASCTHLFFLHHSLPHIMVFKASTFNLLAMVV